MHKQKGYPWEVTKAFDGSAPISKFVNKKSLSNIGAISFGLDINNVTVQRGNTENLIFPINQLISQASQFFTLEPGDLIFTGTTEGVGPIHRGDRLQAYIERDKMLDFFVK